MTRHLSTTDHSRDVAGLNYVYPVISRRTGGLSIGINFNINNACNWRCVYCQVPELKRGAAPALDFKLLQQELNDFLDWVIRGNFYEHFSIPKQQRTLKDIAISGNGEPTSVPDFEQAVALIGEVAKQKGIFPNSRFVLISNGSLVHQTKVQAGLKQLNRFNGELWFKLDAATAQGRKQLNHCLDSNQKVMTHLAIASGLCRTKLQTCLLHYESYPWTKEGKNAYLEFLQLIKEDCKISEVMLYSIARQALQPEATQLKKMTRVEMQQFAEQIKQLGYTVSVNN